MGDKKHRIVFMGTPAFAVASLKKLFEAGCNIIAVITAPDKPAGRGKKMQSSDVKKYAQDKGIKIYQPTNLKNTEFLSEISSLKPDLFVVVAFRMLPEALWSMPTYGTVNLHASLLPQYRGAAPINWAIIHGEKTTGVTTFFIEKEIDTGNIILQEEVEISEKDNFGNLHDKLKTAGAVLLLKTVNAIQDGNPPSIDQDQVDIKDELKPAPKIFKEDCKINWENSIDNIYNFIRGLSPYPAAWTLIENSIKVYQLKVYEVEKQITEHDYGIGKIISDGKNYFIVSVKNGFVSLLSIQLEGKKRLAIKEFLRGFPNPEDWSIKF